MIHIGTCECIILQKYMFIKNYNYLSLYIYTCKYLGFKLEIVVESFFGVPGNGHSCLFGVLWRHRRQSATLVRLGSILSNGLQQRIQNCQKDARKFFVFQSTVKMYHHSAFLSFITFHWQFSFPSIIPQWIRMKI